MTIVCSSVNIAGIGVASTIGSGAASFWQGLFLPVEHPCPDAIDALPGHDGPTLRHGYRLPPDADEKAMPVDRFKELATTVAQEAIHDALIRGCIPNDANIGLAIATGAGNTIVSEQYRVEKIPLSFDVCNSYDIAIELASRLSLPLSGPVFVASNACSAGLYALTHAVDLIRAGAADAMIVVGVEVLSRITQVSFEKMTALDPERCRPFDAERQGTVLGEGAAAVLIVAENLMPHAARKYGQITGIGLSCDAYHPTTPHPDGRDILAAVSAALASARTHDIDLIIPHGTGTPMNDRLEGDMLAEIFGERLTAIPVFPLKSHIGHTAGASGIFSVLTAVIALEQGEIPPTLCSLQPDPAIQMRFNAQPQRFYSGIRRVLVNAYGFGGNNVSLVIERACI